MPKKSKKSRKKKEKTEQVEAEDSAYEEESDVQKSKIFEHVKFNPVFTEGTKQNLVGIEENVEEAEESIDQSQFQDFFHPRVSVESFSPVLTRVEGVQEQVNLEQDVAGVSLSRGADTSNRVDYAPAVTSDYSPPGINTTATSNVYEMDIGPPILEPIRTSSRRVELRPMDRGWIDQDSNRGGMERKEIDVGIREELSDPLSVQERKYKDVKL
ncbi:MAG: hypothetical protein ABIB79_00890 [archaeon]